jgi:dihydrofolate reductase
MSLDSVRAMLRFDNVVSLDGYSAGPDQSPDNPMGVGGMALHQWAFDPVHPTNQAARDEMFVDVGAVIMGRNMFGPIRGDWGDSDWNGWWGEDPPYHMPVYVLTHHARESVEMQGGTTFHFATDGIEAALEQAQAAAGGKDVLIGGGASTVNQYLKAGLVDAFTLHVVPVVLGSGERLLDGLDPGTFALERVVDGPGVTHLHYRVVKD